LGASGAVNVSVASAAGGARGVGSVIRALLDFLVLRAQRLC